MAAALHAALPRCVPQDDAIGMTTKAPAKRPSRPKSLLTLAGLVVGVGSWVISGGIGRLPSPLPLPKVSESPLPRFLSCGVNEVKLGGTFDDCATPDLPFAPFPCSRLGSRLTLLSDSAEQCMTSCST